MAFTGVQRGAQCSLSLGLEVARDGVQLGAGSDDLLEIVGQPAAFAFGGEELQIND